MIEDVYEPLDGYEKRFKEAFSHNTADYFQKLIEQSGVDPAENNRLMTELDSLSHSRSALDSQYSRWSFLRFILWFVFVMGGVAVFFGFANLETLQAGQLVGFIGGGIIAAVGSILLLSLKVSGILRSLDAQIADQDTQIAQIKQRAWQQMQPLNRLYTWDIPARLIQKTVPRLEFDPYFTEDRLSELREDFDWDETFNRDRSMLFSHSGVINGNPFVIGKSLRMFWSTKQYTGTKTIHWTTYERDSNGKLRAVYHSDTLVATVTKPCPEYTREITLFYGNEAAPTLSFSRTPNELSACENGLFDRFAKWSEMKKLEKFSRNLEDESQYTLMSNREFELLFHSTDRNDEVEFRLLFTILAQQQMLKLLKDKKVGFGDDFAFIKNRRLNRIIPAHLQHMELDTNPSQFQDFNLEHARNYFQQYNEDYFKELYFAFAPLLAIPLYQQTRTHGTIYGEKTGKHSCFWEHEAIANLYGTNAFKHPDCITESLLKTICHRTDDGAATIDVTAYGFRGAQRVDIIPVLGGDGRIHDVPVEWIEYLPVQKTTPMQLEEQNGEKTIPPGFLNRRTIWSRIMKGNIL